MNVDHLDALSQQCSLWGHLSIIGAMLTGVSSKITFSTSSQVGAALIIATAILITTAIRLYYASHQAISDADKIRRYKTETKL